MSDVFQAVDTPFGPVWMVPDHLPEKVAKQAARLALAWPDLDGFIAMHTGPRRGGAWLVRAPLAALEARGLPTGSAAEHPVAEGTAWPPIDAAPSTSSEPTTPTGKQSPLPGDLDVARFETTQREVP